MREKVMGSIMGAFVGDSLALGAHWIYDTRLLREKIGRVERLLAPGPGSYHPTKQAGEFTHYGDQTMVLLESLAEKKTFDLEDFSRRWRTLFKDYKGYLDQATKGTLANYSSGKKAQEAGSSSNDLSGAARIAPLAALYAEDLEGLVKAAREQTAMTHRDPLVLDCAEFFAAVLFLVLKGSSPSRATEKIALERFPGRPLEGLVKKGLASTKGDTTSAIAAFGQSCHAPEALPGVVHILCKYEDDLKEALIQSVMAGGDNAARAMAAGMILGAHLGLKAVPEEWLSGLKAGKRIATLLAALL
jgi:ADP-ribosylglycohydrolase